jgi:hypothetical protein
MPEICDLPTLAYYLGFGLYKILENDPETPSNVAYFKLKGSLSQAYMIGSNFSVIKNVRKVKNFSARTPYLFFFFIFFNVKHVNNVNTNKNVDVVL